MHLCNIYIYYIQFIHNTLILQAKFHLMFHCLKPRPSSILFAPKLGEVLRWAMGSAHWLLTGVLVNR